MTGTSSLPPTLQTRQIAFVEGDTSSSNCLNHFISDANQAQDDAGAGAGLLAQLHVRHRLLDLLPGQAGGRARKNGPPGHPLPRAGKTLVAGSKPKIWQKFCVSHITLTRSGF